MGLSYPDSDTQDFGKKCVSNFKDGSSMRKSYVFKALCRTRVGKSVYELLWPDDPYTPGKQSLHNEADFLPREHQRWQVGTTYPIQKATEQRDRLADPVSSSESEQKSRKV